MGAKDVVQAITRAPQVILGVLVVLQDNIKDKQDKLLAVLASLECTAAAMDTKLAENAEPEDMRAVVPRHQKHARASATPATTVLPVRQTDVKRIVRQVPLT